MKQPNIIFILADQLRLQSCGYAGDAQAVTPNLDRLCLESVHCCNMVSSMPVCSAYRASLFTGKYVTSTGMVINELRMNPNHRCLGHCLTGAGYETGYIGKWHLWANELGNHYDPKNSYIPPGSARLGFDGYWAAYNFHHEYYNAWYHTNSPEKIYYGDGVFEPDAQTDMAINYINQQSAAENPFFLMVSYGTPHDRWAKDNVPEKFYQLFDNVSFELPDSYSDVNPDPYGDAWSDITKSPRELQDWMRAYYAMTANLDWNIGRLQQAISRAGIESDTIFIFTSDHGEMFGSHGRMKKNIFYEEAIRVPCMMKWPERFAAGTSSDICISNVDLMPTLLGLAEIDVPADVEGMDLSSQLLAGIGPEPEFAFLQNTGACAAWEDGHEWRGLRTKEYSYVIFRADYRELLFNNRTDPRQLENLAERPEHQGQLKLFRQLLKRKMESLNDTFPPSTWYRDHWISEDRIILRTANLN